jgi:protein TonB
MSERSNLENLKYVSINLDRLGIALSLAIGLHAAVLLGISFTQAINTSHNKQLEITLAQFNEEIENEKPDYLADRAQQASGTELEKSVLSAPEISEYQDIEAAEVSKQQQIQQNEASQAHDADRLFTTDDVDFEMQRDQRAEHEEENQQQDEQNEQARLGELASLAAKLDEAKKEAAKKPRVRRITAVSTKRAMDALYLLKWERKIERIGNQHYPQEARSQKLYGNLSLLVTVLPNGSVETVKILKSSGHRVLDDAAMDIVRMAAPFDNFSGEMAKELDKLEIVRTWSFEKNRLDASQ